MHIKDQVPISLNFKGLKIPFIVCSNSHKFGTAIETMADYFIGTGVQFDLVQKSVMRYYQLAMIN